MLCCESPEVNSKLFHDFAAVLDLKLATGNEKAMKEKCPIPVSEDAIQSRIQKTWQHLRDNGLPFLKGDLLKSLRRNAADRGVTLEQHWNDQIDSKEITPGAFKDTWLPKSRRDVLSEAKIEWLYDMFYKYCSSAVHSDAGASKLFNTLDVNSLVWLIRAIYDTGIEAMIERFGFNICAATHGNIRKHYAQLKAERPIDD